MEARSGIRPSSWIVGALCAWAAGAALAQAGPWSAELAPSGQPRSTLGMQPGKVQVSVGCGASLLPCRTEEAALAARTDPSSLRWSVEMAPVNLGPTPRAALPGTRQGLNLSLVGKRPLFGSSFAVYGKLGTTYGYTESGGAPTTALAPGDSGYGPSFGAGVSMDFTPRLSATLGWDSHDLRLGSGQRDPVRATSLGLQYRY
jgi:hypothetical protein